MTKKIGLIGYFGAGAYSDDLIEYATKQAFLRVRKDLQFDNSIFRRSFEGTNIDYLNKFDLLVHCGGSLLGKCTHPPIGDIHTWARKLKTPFAIFGLGYRMEPDKEPLDALQNMRIHLLFDLAQVITLRGYRTKYWLNKNNLSTSKVSSYVDPVIACDWSFKKYPLFVMGNVRCMPNSEIQHVSMDKIHKFMATCYDWLIEEMQLNVQLVSFRHNLPDDNDLIGARRVRELMKHSKVVQILAPKNFKEALNCLRMAAFWFGQRLHPTIFAATQEIPFIGLEYQFEKMMDFMSTIHGDNFIHMNYASLDTFINKFIGKGWMNIQGNLALKKTEIRETAAKILELI